MPFQAKLLGYAGLIPFVLLPVLSISGSLPYYQAYTFFTQYSAVILSFFGGVHWISALNDPTKSHQLYVAMLPSIVAWLSLVFLRDETLLSALSIAYIAVFLYDKYVLVLRKHFVVDYIKLRLLLTTVVVISHLAMAYL